MPDDDYDWADDETLSLDETVRIFDALGPDVEVTGPPEHVVPKELTFAYTATTTVPTSDFVATTKTETVIITPEAVPIGREYARTA